MKHVHILQHVAFEGSGIIADICKQEGYTSTISHLYAGDHLPTSYVGIQLIVVMGGPMSVLDDNEYPWMHDEKKWLKQAVEEGVRMLGICLGAQLLATALGGRVIANDLPEIGWFPVLRMSQMPPWPTVFPERFDAFHWHGETFVLPKGAKLLASSEGCKNQAFNWHGQVLGLQFHLEVTPAMVTTLCQHCPDDLTMGTWVQPEANMPKSDSYFTTAHAIMLKVMRYMLR